eukprot:6128718-Alexandrium_andersonii.AAC.1
MPHLATRRAGGRAGGASRGCPGGWSPPGKPCATQRGYRSNRRKQLPAVPREGRFLAAFRAVALL